MKKIFTFFAALLLAGSMMGATYSLEKVTSVEAGKSYVFVRNSHALIAQIDSKKLLTTEDYLMENLEGNENYVWTLETYEEGFSIIANDGKYLGHKSKDTEMQLSTSAWAIWQFQFSNGEATIINRKSGNDRFIGETAKGSNTYKAYKQDGNGHNFTVYELVEAGPTDKPYLYAKKINFGTVKISEEATAFAFDTTLEVAAANLTEAITVTNGTAVTATENTLPAEGGTLHLHVNAAPGAFEDTIVLASTDLVVKVAIVGTVKQTVVLPGEPAEMKEGSSCTAVKVNDNAGYKVGSSSYSGDMTITVPANATKLHIFAAAWNGEAGTISLEAEGVTITPEEVTLKDDPCFTGSGTNYILRNLELSDCRFDFVLSGISAKTDIQVSGVYRFIVFGATYESTATAIDNTAVEAKAVKFFENGQLVILKNGVKYNAVGSIVK